MNTANSQQTQIEAVRPDQDLMVNYAGIVVLKERVPRGREHAFLGASSLLFLASATATVYWCTHMSGGMTMPGGWSMSMAWMRMPGQGWLGAAATFMGMWVVMMVAMMLPSLVPMLSIYRRSIRAPGETHLGIVTAIAAAGYFFVWAVFGTLVYSIGLATAAAEMSLPVLAQSVPIAIGVVLLLSGFIQFTAWKSRELTHCRNAANREPESPDARSAWRHGLRLGVHCSLCCSGLMMVLLVTGVMSLGAMALVAAALTAERFAPRPERAARVTGALVIVAGVVVLTRALGGS
jgi:predicted metal-binding membrane protein